MSSIPSVSSAAVQTNFSNEHLHALYVQMKEIVEMPEHELKGLMGDHYKTRCELSNTDKHTAYNLPEIQQYNYVQGLALRMKLLKEESHACFSSLLKSIPALNFPKREDLIEASELLLRKECVEFLKTRFNQKVLAEVMLIRIQFIVLKIGNTIDISENFFGIEKRMSLLKNEVLDQEEIDIIEALWNLYMPKPPSLHSNRNL